MLIRDLPASNKRVVKQTQVGNNLVSTVSLNDPFLNQLDAILSLVPIEGRADLSTPGDYETMVFSCDDEGNVTDFEEKDFARYESWDDAVDGHKVMVEKWSKNV